jgi:hypothetical protein
LTKRTSLLDKAGLLRYAFCPHAVLGGPDLDRVRIQRDQRPLGIGFDPGFGFDVPNIAPYLRVPGVPGIPGILGGPPLPGLPGVKVPPIPDVRTPPVPDVRVPPVPEVCPPEVRVPEVHVPEAHPRR